MFIIVGCVNAVNLTDGIDGLATGVTLPVMLFFTLVSMTAKQWGLATFPATLVGALGGFLFYNFYPAKTFMGELLQADAWQAHLQDGPDPSSF